MVGLSVLIGFNGWNGLNELSGLSGLIGLKVFSGHSTSTMMRDSAEQESSAVARQKTVDTAKEASADQSTHAASAVPTPPLLFA